MVPEGSLLWTQELATGPYPEPDVSNPHLPILLLKVDYNSILPSLRLLSGPFLSGFRPKFFLESAISGFHRSVCSVRTYLPATCQNYIIFFIIFRNIV
jgi:hypothetical protein